MTAWIHPGCYLFAVVEYHSIMQVLLSCHGCCCHDNAPWWHFGLPCPVSMLTTILLLIILFLVDMGCELFGNTCVVSCYLFIYCFGFCLSLIPEVCVLKVLAVHHVIWWADVLYTLLHQDVACHVTWWRGSW
jgi:hypothetical protein